MEKYALIEKIGRQYGAFKAGMPGSDTGRSGTGQVYVLCACVRESSRLKKIDCSMR